MYFDGARCKHGAGDGVILKSHKGGYKRFIYRVTWACTNNATKYEALCLGMAQATKMGIRCLKVFGDSKLAIK